MSLVLITLRCWVTEKALNWEGHLIQATHILSPFTNSLGTCLWVHLTLIFWGEPKGLNSRLSRYGEGL